MQKQKNTTPATQIGFYSSILLTVFSIAALGFGLIAIPPAGPNCPSNCMEYPFPEILNYFPRDYIWMCISIVQLFIFMVFIISHHYIATAQKKIFSLISIAFALGAVTILASDYFIQIAVVPISVMKGETEGIPLLTQYNGHGIFIALEELGYLMTSISFLFLTGVYKKKTRLEKSLRWILPVPFIVSVLALVIYTIIYKLDRDYRFEVVTLSISWLVMIVAGILAAVYFKRKGQADSAD